MVLLFLFIIGFVLFSLGGYLFLNLIAPQIWQCELPEISIDISNTTIQVLSTLVTVPLAFIIVFVWDNYHDTIILAQQQASLLLLLYNDIKRLGDKKLLHLIRQYILAIPSGKADITVLRNAILDYTPNKDNQVRYDQIVMTMNDLYNISGSIYTSTIVSAEVWIVIFFGSLFLMMSTWFIKSPPFIHLFLIVGVAAILGSLVFLIYLHSNPLNINDNEIKQIYQDLLDRIDIKN